MATFHIDRDLGTTFTITSAGNTYILDEDASIVVAGNAMVVNASAANTTLMLDGWMLAGGMATALLSVADNADITIGHNGALIGNFAARLAGRDVTFANNGLLEGLNYGVEITSQTIDFTSTGEIFGDTYGIVLGELSERESFTITNDGLIDADIGISTSARSGVIVLGENSRIVGEDYGITAFTQLGGTTEVTNHGFIKAGGPAAYQGWTGVDTFTNFGFVRGDIELGDGDDQFVGRDGRVIGQVLGGRGDDLYQVHSAKTRVFEAAGEGDDTIRASVSYQLTGYGEIESLILVGRKNLVGSGNQYDNIISGNRGDNRIDGAGGQDVLIGLEGRDIFAFSPDAFTDQIFDFENGADRIEISGFAGYDSFEDLTIVKAGLNVEIGLVSNGQEETVVIENAKLSWFGASDFIFS